MANPIEGGGGYTTRTLAGHFSAAASEAFRVSRTTSLKTAVSPLVVALYESNATRGLGGSSYQVLTTDSWGEEMVGENAFNDSCFNETLNGTFLNCNGSGTTAAPDGIPEYEPWQKAILGIIISAMIIVTVVGNILVIAAVSLVRRLRTPPNYLYVSLAVADLCVGFLVMPISLIYTIVDGYSWRFSFAVCDMWIAFDVICCTASIMTLCGISVDRYLAITKPFWYARKRTSKLMITSIIVMWFISFLVIMPPTFGLGLKNVKFSGPNPFCLICQDEIYTIYSTVLAFYLPCFIMVVIYLQIYKAAYRTALQDKRTSYFAQRKPSSSTLNDSNQNNKMGSEQKLNRAQKLKNAVRRKSVVLQNRISLGKERKAARTLGVVMGTFIICWLPFFILAMYRAYCGCQINPHLDAFLLWLGYANSLMNPVIYPMLNKEFRKPFKNLLCCRFREATSYTSTGSESMALTLKIMAEERKKSRLESRERECSVEFCVPETDPAPSLDEDTTKVNGSVPIQQVSSDSKEKISLGSTLAEEDEEQLTKVVENGNGPVAMQLEPSEKYENSEDEENADAVHENGEKEGPEEPAGGRGESVAVENSEATTKAAENQPLLDEIEEELARAGVDPESEHLLKTGSPERTKSEGEGGEAGKVAA